jgi:hypothetical protein
VAIIEKPNPVLACNVDAKKTITPVIRRISTKTPPINNINFSATNSGGGGLWAPDLSLHPVCK